MVLCIFRQVHRNNWSFDYFSLKFEHLLMKPLLCFYFFIVDIQMELNQEFSGRKMDKDKTDRSQKSL